MMKQLVGHFGMAFAALAITSLVGCTTTIKGGDGGGGDGGAGGATATGTDTGTGTGGATTGTGVPPDCGDFAACAPPAYVLTHAQEAAATGEDPNGGLLSDTQFLFWGVGAQEPSCGNPYGEGGGCGGFNVAVEIPTSYLVVGTIPLSDPEVHTMITETFGEGGNTCAGSGGIDVPEGQIEITSVNDVVVQFTVTGLPVDSPGNFNMNGSFVGTRCP
ncbi:MAG: hypothetical protein U0441_27900 [Polyangiaceae bacterium]